MYRQLDNKRLTGKLPSHIEEPGYNITRCSSPYFTKNCVRWAI